VPIKPSGVKDFFSCVPTLKLGRRDRCFYDPAIEWFAQVGEFAEHRNRSLSRAEEAELKPKQVCLQAGSSAIESRSQVQSAAMRSSPGSRAWALLLRRLRGFAASRDANCPNEMNSVNALS